jgi:hypothetical protein
MHELRNGPITLKRGGTGAYKREKKQTSSIRTTHRGPTAEAPHRFEPQKSVRRLRESINITLQTS